MNAREMIVDLQGLLAYSLTENVSTNLIKMECNDTFSISAEALLGGEVPPWLKFGKTGLPLGFERASDASSQDKSSKDTKSKLSEENKRRKVFFVQAQAAWRKKYLVFEKQKRLFNETLKLDRINFREQYYPEIIELICNRVLKSSRYPDCIPRKWTLEYRHESKLLVIDLYLPAPDDLPTIDYYKYVKSKNVVTEKLLSDKFRKKLYNDVLYQICLRTLHELFKVNAFGAIESISLNGLVMSCNRATGANEAKIILSLICDRKSFEDIDLSNIEPKAAFRHLKGVAATELYELTPIPPVIALIKSDRRFIQDRSVEVDHSTNLAAMHWGDFEHLIRELFENEFGRSGEVRVTQASRDGGVDAIAFDLDPVRGGKIVIQAKRYTNTVDVSAVRDLYGTVMNEGAMKGILVTTSDYGKDAYLFARDKPITLLNGSNLLALLAKHGRSARIDIVEAKKMLGAP